MADVASSTTGTSKKSAGGVGLRFYKPGQGYHTRLWTAIGAGILSVWGAIFIQSQLAGYMNQNTSYYLPVQYGVSVAFLVLMGIVIYWVVGIGHKTNDFFIATEGEMKKVSWSTRQEIIRSTKVVIVTTVLLAMFLFIADILFMEFFSAINVLQIPSTLERIFGS